MANVKDLELDRAIKIAEIEKNYRFADRMRDLPALGSKSLTLLNSGAAVAMLGFTTALIEKSVYCDFKQFGLLAIVFFLLGAFFGSVPFFAQRYYYMHEFTHGLKVAFWHKVVWGLLYVSAAFAFIGGGVVVRGIYIAL